MLHVSPPFLCVYQTKYIFDGPILWCLHVQRVLFNIKLSNLHMKVCDECNRTKRHYLVRDEYVYCDISIKRGGGGGTGGMSSYRDTCINNWIILSRIREKMYIIL